MNVKRCITLSKADTRRLKDFGQNVRKVRENKHLTVYDVTGDDMPIKSRQHWQRIENGKKNINLTTVFKIADTLEVSASDLLT